MQIVDELFVKDPNGAMLAFADMMRKQIVMPAHLMDDGEHIARNGRNLFAVRALAGGWVRGAGLGGLGLDSNCSASPASCTHVSHVGYTLLEHPSRACHSQHELATYQ